MSDTAKVVHINKSRSKPKAAHYEERSKRYQLDITERELKQLRKFVETEGPAEMADAIGVSEPTLMKVCAGFLEHCRLDTRQKVREFFGGLAT